MPSYDSFMCPNCEHHFRVIWPEPVPTHYHLCSKIKMKCPDCNEVSELYDFLSTKYCRLLNPVSRGFVCFSPRPEPRP